MQKVGIPRGAHEVKFRLPRGARVVKLGLPRCVQRFQEVKFRLRLNLGCPELPR